MKTEDIKAYCRGKNRAYEDHPFGDIPVCYKLNGKIFAQIYPLEEERKITLKCSRDAGDFYRQVYPGIVVRGYHCPPVQQPFWNTVYHDRLPDEELLNMIDHAYEQVLHSFSRKVQKELETEPSETGKRNVRIWKKEKKKELKQYITGAGACVVTKSVLNGETGLKWLFRETDGIGNGWVALGESDTQAYVDDAANYAIVDFNTLANIEPAVLNILHMPAGADLEFKPDPSGGYFVDTVNGKEIREPVKAPIQEAFEQNLKYLNKESYPAEELLRYFHGKGDMRIFCMGEADFPSGEIIIADPLVYLGNDKYTEPLNRKIPTGSYPVELAILDSPVAGLRIAAARLKIRETDICRYEIAMPAGTTAAQYNQPGIFAGFGVDAGMACFCDAAAAKEFGEFSDGWHQQNPGKNQYDDYFAQLFRSSYEAYPDVQREDGDFIEWEVPGYGHRIAMFASGLGDGLYTGYWGLDAGEEVTELIIPFMNPDYFS